MRPLIAALSLLISSASCAWAGSAPLCNIVPQELKPWEQHSFDFETGMLWKVGGSTTLNYRIIPFMLSWRSPEVFGFDFANGSHLTLRNKLTGMANYFETGAENRYLGISGAPSIEWWSPSRAWSVFGAVGGGVGWVDSQGVPGGQGQDFTLNWYGQAGVSRALTHDWSLRVSGMFQHHSNGGATDPNPGLNSLGFLIGVSRSF